MSTILSNLTLITMLLPGRICSKCQVWCIRCFFFSKYGIDSWSWRQLACKTICPTCIKKPINTALAADQDNSNITCRDDHWHRNLMHFKMQYYRFFVRLGKLRFLKKMSSFILGKTYVLTSITEVTEIKP